MEQATDDAQTRADIMRDFEEALQPLVDDGSIHTVEVITELRRNGRLFTISWLSKRGEPGDIVLTDPLSLNG
jgi:phage gp46-like protein